MMQNMEFVKNLLIGACGVSFLVSVFLATIVFDEVSPDTTLPDEEIEMGMAIQATDQHIEVFFDAVLYLQISTDLKNIHKTDEKWENVDPEEGTAVDLFPVGSSAYGRGTVEFKIKTLKKSEFPSLGNGTYNKPYIPMAYVRAESLNPLAKSALKLANFGIKGAGIMAWLGVLLGAACIFAGIVLLYLDSKKPQLEEEDEEED